MCYQYSCSPYVCRQICHIPYLGTKYYHGEKKINKLEVTDLDSLEMRTIEEVLLME
jgi:hypothetical protein